MPMGIVANDLPGNSYTMHPAAGANLVDIPDHITDSVMIEIDPVFQMRSMVVAGMVMAPFTLDKHMEYSCCNIQ